MASSRTSDAERARRYLQASMKASYTGLPTEHREAHEAQMASHERAYGRVREHALAGADQDFDERLTPGEREHQKHLRRQDNMTEADVTRIRRELRGQTDSQPRRRAPGRRRAAGAGAGPRAAAAATAPAQQLLRGGGNTGLYIIGVGLLLCLFYLLVAGKGAGALTGIVNVIAGAAGTFTKPVDPIAKLESALGATPVNGAPDLTHNAAGGVQETGPGVAYGTPLKGNKAAFASALTKLTGLNATTVEAWLNHEQGASTVEGGNNWLNVETGGPGGGSGPYSATAKYVEHLGPEAAAAYTAKWIEQNQPSILAARGKGQAAEVKAIEDSGFAESHYGNASPAEFLAGA